MGLIPPNPNTPSLKYLSLERYAPSRRGKSIRRSNTIHSNQEKRLTSIFTVNNLTINETKTSLREKKGSSSKITRR